MTTQFSASQKIIEMDDKYTASVALCAVGIYAAIKTYENDSYIACALVTFCTLVRAYALGNVVIADLQSFVPKSGSWYQRLKFLVMFIVIEFGLVFAFVLTLTGFLK
ncbi:MULTISPECIES: hypothetical protein [Pectobacterium]|uniref:hypothetical protein n=1 Tax=Pectobacterium TaxID=122277 RepID=UPI001B3630BB|nr:MULTISPECIES: hypothetical protein [Pectobacterium]MBQ4788064.1 hypothetical protein [Pectobacterium versatile]UVD99392.1 hypothetical protein NV347_10585 [Pectobacterium parvum]